ncbi:MAG TPA: M20/M25/M40 family metallo-hydrolase [Blastocatellia bacterium]|nr:M20/M25/M40 family metallo-hydrolase [Blastocatellia bacterium]
MKRHFNRVLAPVAVVLIFSFATGAQVAQEKIDLDAINRIRTEGLERSQVMETLSWLTDVYGPRLTNSPNYKAASEWAKNRLAEWGLQNAHLEPWGPFGRGWSLEGFSANVIKPSFTPLIAYPKAWSPSTNGAVRGSVVYFDTKTEADLEKYKGKLKGAIVLLSPPREVKAHFTPEGRRQTDEDLLRLANADPSQGGGGRNYNLTPEMRAQMELARKKWQMIYDEGSAVVLESGRGDGGTIFVQSVTLPSPSANPMDARAPRAYSKDTKAIPQAVIAAEQYNRIIRTLTKGVPVEMEVQVTSRFYDQDLMCSNVIAEIPGTDLKDEVVMVGGHFDSWHSGTGATDNAAGSAVAMEVVRIIQSLGIKPRRTIRIGLWGGEEEGLLGSRAYVSQHFGERQPLPPGQQPQGGGGGMMGQQGPLTLKPEHAKLAAYFNLDNGTGKIRGVYLQGNDAVRPIFRAWLAPFKEMGASTLTISNTGGTDHLSFDAVGLPGFQFIQDEVEYDTRTHHSNMDVYDRIQADDMKQASVIIASFVYNAAMRDEKLPRKPLPPGTQQQASAK